MHPLLLLPLPLLLISAAAEVPHKEPAVSYLSQLLGTHGQLLGKLLASEGEGGPDVKDQEELLLTRLLAMSQLDQQLLGLLSDRKELCFLISKLLLMRISLPFTH
jgi:hypothetical protein